SGPFTLLVSILPWLESRYAGLSFHHSLWKIKFLPWTPHNYVHKFVIVHLQPYVPGHCAHSILRIYMVQFRLVFILGATTQMASYSTGVMFELSWMETTG